jgi:hypothetical protein
MRHQLTILWRVVRVLLVAYLGIMLVMVWLENSFIYYPVKYPSGDWSPPGLEFEDAWFEADDGTRLHGWFLEHPEAIGTALFCHGNAGNLAWRADMVRLLRDRSRLNVLIFDYRGYGRSDGRPSEQGVYADARAARRWLADRVGIEPAEVILMGRSIGGAVAVELAATDGAGGLVLESTFTSLPDVAADFYPFLPVRWLMTNRFESIQKIPNYEGPLLQTHGEADTLVPIEQGRRLFDAAAQAEPRAFISYPGLDHNDPQPLDYYDRELPAAIASWR